MKRLLCCVVLSFIPADLAFGWDAQASPETTGERISIVEIFAGYSYLPETDAFVQSFSDSGHGLAAAMNANFNKYIGLAVDFDSGSWTVHGHGTEDFWRGDKQIRLSSLSIGPRVTMRTKRFALFGMPTLDYQRSRFSSQTIVDSLNPENRMVPASNANAWGLGFVGGADLTLGKRMSLRMIQINYFLGGYGEGPGRKLRIKTGVVLRFR